MRINRQAVYIFTTFLLFACSHNPNTLSPKIGHNSLLHSATYTQKKLIELEFSALSKTGKNRYQLLLKANCDLIERGVVYVEKTLSSCLPSLSSDARLCFAAFHQCVSSCNFFKNNCWWCEQTAANCLTNKV